MKENPLLALANLGQSIWLDYTRRDLILSGDLRRLIEEDGLRGMTSNPSIFEKAIVSSEHYDEDIQAMVRRRETPNAIYESLSQRDVQAAADEFRRVYDKEDGKDGFVSLEVNPHLAHDTQGTVKEARRLWRALNRPNVFIKVPATAEGVPAIQQLITEGINVNVTLLFDLPRYQQVAEAYIAGLEARVAERKPLKAVASVASFFLSRIDSLVDPKLEKLIAREDGNANIAQGVRGEVAIASAKAAYQMYKELFGSDRFAQLAARGARSQRLLWASTSTKNPAYSDLKYVDALIGPETINTVTVETLDAYRDHGKPKPTLEQDVAKAKWVLEQLSKLEIDLSKVTAQLENEGVEKFNKAFDNLSRALSNKAGLALN
jgi:transaldolase